MQIGIIENSPKLAELLKVGLELSGHIVHLYESAQEATSAILEARFHQQQPPCDILIVDEESNESQLIKRIRMFLTSEELPVIILQNTYPLLSINIHTLCDVKIVEKPVTANSLIAAIEEITSER